MDGILIIDKPAGWTSHDVVAKLRGILKTKRIGHTGTLDPFATGVLVMLVGKVTRLAQFLDKDQKEYEAVVRLGFETDTGDRTGKPSAESGVRNADLEEIKEVLTKFVGEIEQTPPMYSAKKIDGKKLYDLARKGIEVERKPVKITIYDLGLIEPQRRGDAEPDIGLYVRCSAGTYIRTLAEDIGRALKTGAHLAELRRTAAGKFNIGQAVTLDQIEKLAESGEISSRLISMNDALSHLPEVKLDETDLQKVKNGVAISAKIPGENVQSIRMTDAGNALVAVGSYAPEEEIVKPRIVFLND